MEIKKLASVKPILGILLILCVICAVFTLTACGNELDATKIEVVSDTVPDVDTVGSFELSQVKLKVTCADGSEQEIAVTQSMLDTASKNSLKEAGEKTINVYYSDCATTFTIFLVEEGTETISVTFYAQDGTKLAKKYAVKDEAIEAPSAPTVEGMIFDCWVNKSTGQEVDLSSVSADLIVYASYTENASKFTVKFYDYNNVIVATYTDIAYNSTITQPTYVKPSDVATYYWNWNFGSDRITQNTSIYMTITYVERVVTFKYVYSTDEGEQQFDLNTTTTVKLGSAPSTASKTSAISEMTSKGKTFKSWINEEAVRAGTTYTMIALVESCNYIIEFSDGAYEDVTVRSGKSYTFPTQSDFKQGYSFANQWEDTDGNIYNGGTAYAINSDLTVSGVYEADSKNAIFTFGFDGLLKEGGDTLTYSSTKQVKYDDVITRTYINSVLSALKVAYPAISAYDIDLITYTNTNVIVTNSGLKIGESATHSFAVACVDVSLGTPGLVYTLNDDSTGYLISGYTPTDNAAELNIVIPATHKVGNVTLPVVGIDDGVFSATTQTVALSMNITLPSGLTSIGDNAFSGVEFLSNISIPASIKSIGNSAFAECTSEVNGGITITFLGGDATFTTISEFAFAEFAGLSKVVLPSTVTILEEGCFSNSADLIEVSLTNITTIGDGAFVSCEKLTTVGNLNKVTSIGYSAFAMTKITTLSLPAINTLDPIALFYMESLTTLSIATGATGDNITFDFANLALTGVTTLTLGERVTAITNTMAVNVMLNAVATAQEAYAASKLITINLPRSMTVINVASFSSFPLIKTITLASGSNYTVSDYALFTQNTLVYYPANVYGDYTIPATVSGNNITIIADGAFISAKFNKLILQSNVEYTIGTTGIQDLNVLQMSVLTAQSICSTLFTETVDNVLQVLDAKFNASTIYYLTGYSELSVEDKASVDLLVSDASARFIKDANSIPSYYDAASKLLYTVDQYSIATVVGGNPTATEITIPAKLGGYTVGYLGDNAFDGYIYLTTLTINATLVNLNSTDTFKDCIALETVTLAGITNINEINRNLFDDTLWYAENVILVLAGIPVAYNTDYSITTGGNTTIVTTVSASDLAGATIIPVGFFKDSALTAITLPSTVTIIDESAFEHCTALKTITLTGVNILRKYAFKDCTALTSVTIPNAVNGDSASDGKLPVGVFSGCSALTTVTMPKVNGLFHDGSAQMISDAFYNCVNLTDLSFLSNFTGIIYAQAFYGCSSVKQLDLSSSNITSIGADAFTNSGLTYLVLGSVNTIGANAFGQTADPATLTTARIKGTGGIFTTGIAIAAGIFPAGIIIYIDAGVDTNTADTVLANYTHRTAEPRITYAMKAGFEAGNNTLGMTAVSASYMESAPSAPTFTGYVFVGWFIGDEEVVFPYTFTGDTELLAKYYSTSQGSLIDSDLVLIEGNNYRLDTYSSEDTTCYIPSVFVSGNKNYIITTINLSAFAGSNITSLVIPEGVITLTGSLAGSNITSIYIAASVTSITATDAFTNMTELTIEWAANSNLVTAYDSAFQNTKWYSAATLDANEGHNNRFIVAGRLAIKYCASTTASENRTVEVPSQVIKLNDSLFANNLELRTITLNDGLQIIGTNCFANASNLETVNYVTEASNSAIKEASASAFAGTKWLNNQNQVIIGTIYIKYNGIYAADNVNIPGYITKIATNAFLNAAIKTITFGGNNVTAIGDYAFKGSTLTGIVLPSSVTTMGTGVYQNCVDLLTANLSGANITSLPAYTFDGCTTLTTMTLGSKVIKFGVASIGNCTELANITASGLVDTTGLLQSGIITTAWYQQEAGVTDLHLILGKVYIKYKTGTNPTLNASNLIEITIPAGIVVISQGAFSGNSQIGKVTIASSVEKIEENAFYNCSSLLTVIFNGNSVISIGDTAFSGASSLTDMTLPNSLQSIGKRAFDSTALTEVTIPDAVTTIGEYAFTNNALLETLVLGRGLTYVGQYAFSDCDQLYKITWALEVTTISTVATISQLYNINEGSLTDTNYTSNATAYINTIFSSSVAIRMYVPSNAYSVIVSSSAPAYVANWNNSSAFDIFIEGNLPSVNFDCDGYIMVSLNVEVINSLSTPSKTNNTFIRWEINNAEITLPYKVYSDVTITAVWYNNIRTTSMTDVLSYSPNYLSDGITAISYSITDIQAGNTTMYVPNIYNNLPVVGFNFTSANALAHAATIKKIIFTQASNITGITTNIMKIFTGLESVQLLDSNTGNINYYVSNGALYSIDGKVLIAYFIQKNTSGAIITSFNVPSTVTTILPYAFVNSGLTSITIPAAVTAIGENAFNNGMTNITFNSAIYLQEASKDSFSNTVWYTNNSYELYTVSGSAVGRFYAAGNMLLTYYEISETSALALPNTVKGFNITVIASEIYTYPVTARTTAYTLITLPNKLIKINENAFALMDTLSFDGSACAATLVSIAANVFDDTQYYNTSSSGEDLLKLGKVLLRYRNTASTLDLSAETFTTIANNAFAASQLVSITLPSTLTYIADEAFYGSDKLESITIPANVTEIGEGAFKSCTSLSTITFADGSKLTKIGASAFEMCWNLTTIKIPYTVKTIGDNAFNNCQVLETITFDKILTTVNVETGVVTTTIQAKSELKSLGVSAFEYCIALESISIPNGLTEISESTFRDCTSLVTVNFESDKSLVKTIGAYAFYGCTALGSIIDITSPSLVTVVLPNALITVEDYAFAYCNGMYGIQFNYNIGVIGEKVFEGCRTLAKIVIYADTPPQISSNSLTREVGSIIPYYHLRIYVKNATKVFNDFKVAFASYYNATDASLNCLYTMGTYATLTYRYHTEGSSSDDDDDTVSANERKDIYVNPSHLFENNVTVTVWKFASVNGNTTDSRVTTTLGAADYQKQHNYTTSTNDLILVMDYDIILQNVSQ